MMRKVRRKNTEPELIVRRLLHRLGYRFRLHAEELAGSPDIVLRPRKAAIFVHGCFWHGHDCRKAKLPTSNISYWAAKIERNRVRDAAAIAKLSDQGWRSLVVWECELSDEANLTLQLMRFLDNRTATVLDA